MAHPPIEEKIWMMIVWSGALINILIGLMGWLILPNGFYRGTWAAFQIGFGIINLMPFSPDGEKLFAYYQTKEQKRRRSVAHDLIPKFKTAYNPKNCVILSRL